jgi:hypothetical protein
MFNLADAVQLRDDTRYRLTIARFADIFEATGGVTRIGHLSDVA